MKIVLNFLPLKTGGGLQVAIDFLNQCKLGDSIHSWYLVARKGTPFEKFADEPYIYDSHFVEDNYVSRLFFETLSANDLMKKWAPDVIYTQFGPRWIRKNNVKNVVGCAYSNLFYPEIDFWKGYGPIKKFERKLVDCFRLRMVKLSDYVIFETEDLARRSVKQGVLDDTKADFVLPAPSSNVDLQIKNGEVASLLKGLPERFTLCLISTYSINKNFEILVMVLKELNRLKNPVSLITTLNESEERVQALFTYAEKYGVRGNIFNIGPIPVDGCAEVYRASDASILPANLESFSNNIAESWKMSVPLIISDKSWAHSLCRDAAIYVDIDSVENIAQKIIDIKSNEDFRARVTNKGKKRLLDYPTSLERYQKYVEILERVAG